MGGDRNDGCGDSGVRRRNGGDVDINGRSNVSGGD